MENLALRIAEIFSTNKSDAEKCARIDDIGDILGNSNIDYIQMTDVINILINNIHGESDEVKESILNTILVGLEDKEGFDYKQLLLDKLVSEIDKLDSQCTSYVVTLLGFSGNKKYIVVLDDLLLSVKKEYVREDIEIAKKEIEYRVKKQENNENH